MLLYSVILQCYPVVVLVTELIVTATYSVMLQCREAVNTLRN